MNREELDGQSKPELIDLVVRQQEHIDRLQAQIAQLQLLAVKKNGSELDALAAAGAQAVPVGQFPRAFKLILIASLALVCGLVALIATFRPDAAVSAGLAQDFPPGSVTVIQLPPSSRGAQSIPILLVNDPSAGFLALYARDPESNCLLIWDASAEQIIDPCQASRYTRAGEYVRGPSPRGLDRYTVSVTDSGEIRVDASTLKSGPPRP